MYSHTALETSPFQPTFDIVLDGFDGAEDAVELLLDCATGLNRDYLDILEDICGREDGV